MASAALLSAGMNDEEMSYEVLIGQLTEARRLLHLYEIDNKALKSRCEVAEARCEVLEEQGKNLEFDIEKLELQIKDLEVDRAFMREELAEAKLYIVKLQDILDLKQASDKARLRSWDVFKSLYTLESSCTELNFVEQRLDDEGAVIVADTFDVFSSLSTLNLSDNMIAAKGMEALSIPLARKTSLRSLTLAGNQLGDDSMDKVGMVLSMVSITSLNLGQNQISCTGAGILASTLSPDMPASQYLTRLDLHGNEIAAKGAEAIAQALMSNTTLDHLNLGKNQVGDYGATHLAAMLRTNNGITDLNLSCNDLRDTGVRELCSAIVENEKLRTFRVGDNAQMGTEGNKALTTLQKSTALARKLRVYF